MFLPKPDASDDASDRIVHGRLRKGRCDYFRLKLQPAMALKSGESPRPSFSSAKNTLLLFVSTWAPAMMCPPARVSLLSTPGPGLSNEKKWTARPAPT